MNTEVKEIMQELESLGTEQTRKTFRNHGAKGELFGVKVGDLKVIQKRIRKNHALALGLYDTLNSDAMYLAGLISDPLQMTPEDLQHWVEKAEWEMISEYTVAWVAAESKYGWEKALEWIQSPVEHIAASGWATLSCLMSLKKDEDLNVAAISGLLDFIAQNIHTQPNRVKYTMNGFVISAGSFVGLLTEKAKDTAKAIGKVQVFMGNTSCKVPDAFEYIVKVEQAEKTGKKKKTVFC